jgi:ketosteroid isomerase-like protein
MNQAETNAEVVRRGYAAFNAADIETLSEVMPENATWHTPGRSRIAGDHIGRSAVFAQFGRYGGETNGTFKAELKQVFGSDNGRVVAIHHNSGQRNGRRPTRLLHRLRGRERRWSPGGNTSTTCTTGTRSGVGISRQESPSGGVPGRRAISPPTPCSGARLLRLRMVFSSTTN